jgi:hydroxymethylpyrimidine/phosphomethylpyrimidine kinase
LFPLAAVVTPNIPEAERICGTEIISEADIVSSGNVMLEMGAKAVLIKGGHRFNEAGQAVDHLFADGEHKKFAGEYIRRAPVHGTGCTLSAAIAANLARGRNLSDAIKVAKEFVLDGIRNAEAIGKGNSPVRVPPIWPAG